MTMKAMMTAAALSLSAIATGAQAGNFGFVYLEADVATEDARIDLMQRLVMEAEIYCHEEYGADDPDYIAQDDCRDRVVTGIVRNIDDVRFTALFDPEIRLAAIQ